MMQCVKNGHEVVALVNMEPVGKDELDSFMYQTVGHEMIDAVAECLDLPLFRAPIKGAPRNTEYDYQPTENDEVEDLYDVLKKVQTQFPDIKAVSSGAIRSNYQRLRVENICKRLHLTSLAYLWERDQTELLQEMIDEKLEAVIIKVAAAGLNPSHLGKSIKEMMPHLLLMKEKYSINVCGEGGEFESLTLDCPLYKKRIIL